jgi:hypothetical protein
LRCLDDLNLFLLLPTYAVLFCSPHIRMESLFFCLTYTFLRAVPVPNAFARRKRKKKRKKRRRRKPPRKHTPALSYVCMFCEGYDTTCTQLETTLIVDALSNHTAKISKIVSESKAMITQKTAWHVPLNPPSHSERPTGPRRRCRPESP